jgi:AcrR family transcriptional regulator
MPGKPLVKQMRQIDPIAPDPGPTEIAARPVRARILAAAARIAHESGMRGLAQAKVAAAADIRQSHLQYYFPRKRDLIAALLHEHVEMATHGEPAPHPPSRDDALGVIAANAERMRFFIGLILEAERDPALRDMVADHADRFRAEVATWFGRDGDDPDVELFLNTLRGIGLMRLVRANPAPVDFQALARRFGLVSAGW